MRGLNEFCADVHAEVRGDGWWHDEANPLKDAVAVTMIGSEVYELLEVLRRGRDPGDMRRECADIMLRLADFIGKQGIDIEAAIEEVRANNRIRLDHRPVAGSLPGGKNF